MEKFDKTFGGAANLGKQLEVRWFFQDKNNTAVKKPCHDMPFKRRNLTYVQSGTLSSRKRKRTLDISKTKKAKSKKKIDLLFQCFKYRIKNFNPVFLESRPTKIRKCRNNVVEEETMTMPNETKRALENGSMKKENQESTSRDAANGAMVSVSTGDVEAELDDIMLTPRIPMSPLSTSCSDDAPSIQDHMKILTAPSFHNDPTDQTGNMRTNMNMFFHYIYHDSNGLPTAIVEGPDETAVGHRRCPFCYFDGGTDSGILMHCTLFHGKRLLFEAARSEDGTLHIAVRRKPYLDEANDISRDFMFNRRGQKAPDIATVPIVQRQARKAATLDLPTRKKKIRLLQDIGAKPSIMKAFVPSDDVPLRQYFHSRPIAPMLVGEWCYDSDEEPDDEWLHRMGEELLEEFVEEDVSPDEKNFLKMWNRFMISHSLIPDFVVPQKCVDFIHSHIKDMVNCNLRRELVLHLFNLWDSGIISCAHMVHCMTLFDTLATKLISPVVGPSGNAVNQLGQVKENMT